MRFALRQLLPPPACTAVAMLALLLLISAGCKTSPPQRAEMGAGHSKPGMPRGVRVPFELFGNNILVPVRLNGSEPSLFIFDTGAAVSVVDQRWAEQLGLANDGGVKLNAGGGAIEGRFAKGHRIEIPGLQSTNQLLAVVPLDIIPPLFGREIRGILGNTFIKAHVIEIDYADRILTFYSPAAYNLAGESRATPFEDRGGVPFVELTLRLDDAEAITGLFEIDSGSNGSLQINRPFAEQHRIRDRVPKHLMAEGIGGAGVGGDMKCLDARIREIRWGDFVLKAPIVSLSQDEAGVGAGGDGGLIGGEVLRRFTVVLDYQSKRVLLTPNSSLGEAFGTDLSGIELMTASDDLKKILIKTVRQGFPAAAAGLQKGDVIESVNGRPASEFNLDEWSRMLKQPGKRLALGVRRDGELHQTQIVLRKRI